MKNYSIQDKAMAQGKLPKPTVDFMSSKELAGIYTGIAKKLKLNLRQVVGMAEVTNATLLGLEPQSALETNIHQILPELTNAETKELVADINDRIFKEARRRLEEDITAPEKPWPIEELGPKDEYEKAIVSDTEYEAFVREEELRTGKPYVPEVDLIRIRDEEAEKKRLEHETTHPKPIPTEEEDPEDDGFDYDAPVVTETPSQEEIPGTVVPTPPAPETPLAVPAVPIALRKLSEPTVARSSTTEAEKVVVSQVQEIQKVAPPPRLKGDSDPYREILD